MAFVERPTLPSITSRLVGSTRRFVDRMREDWLWAKAFGVAAAVTSTGAGIIYRDDIETYLRTHFVAPRGQVITPPQEVTASTDNQEGGGKSGSSNSNSRIFPCPRYSKT